MTDYPTCPHDRETFVREDALYSYRCPECKSRVCLDCRRYGNKGFMLPLVSWMTGVCDDCRAERGRRQRIRSDYHLDRERREALARVWDEGSRAALDHAVRNADGITLRLDKPNPYAEPTAYERRLLEQHPWLRDEVRP